MPLLNMLPGPEVYSFSIDEIPPQIQLVAATCSRYVYCNSVTGVQGLSETTSPSAYFSNDFIYFQAPTSWNGSWEIELYDMNGKILRQLSTRNELETISTVGFATGIYMLRMTNGEKIYSQKLCITP